METQFEQRFYEVSMCVLIEPPADFHWKLITYDAVIHNFLFVQILVRWNSVPYTHTKLCVYSRPYADYASNNVKLLRFFNRDCELWALFDLPFRIANILKSEEDFNWHFLGDVRRKKSEKSKLQTIWLLETIGCLWIRPFFNSPILKLDGQSVSRHKVWQLVCFLTLCNKTFESKSSNASKMTLMNFVHTEFLI